MKKFNKTEIWIFIVMAIIIGYFAGLGILIHYRIERAGGVNNTIVEFGKEIKDISRRISEE